MAVLTATKTWRRPETLGKARTPDLTEEERAHVRRAALFLRAQLRGTAKLAAALASLSTGQATVGATEQELQAVASALGTQAAGTTAAQDGIQDSNTADDVLSLTRFQILNQAGTKALGSADQASMQLLQLLQ